MDGHKYILLSVEEDGPRYEVILRDFELVREQGAPFSSVDQVTGMAVDGRGRELGIRTVPTDCIVLGQVMWMDDGWLSVSGGPMWRWPHVSTE